MGKKTVDEYIAEQESFKADILSAARKVVKDTAPDAEEAVKWAQPVYSLNGPFLFMKAFKDHVNVGFWRGVDLEDPKGLLEGSGVKMRHIKVFSADEIDAEALASFITQAIILNAKKGDPTR